MFWRSESEQAECCVLCRAQCALTCLSLATLCCVGDTRLVPMPAQGDAAKAQLCSQYLTTEQQVRAGAAYRKRLLRRDGRLPAQLSVLEWCQMALLPPTCCVHAVSGNVLLRVGRALPIYFINGKGALLGKLL